MLGEPLFLLGDRSRVGNKYPWVNSRQILRWGCWIVLGYHTIYMPITCRMQTGKLWFALHFSRNVKLSDAKSDFISGYDLDLFLSTGGLGLV